VNCPLQNNEGAELVLDYCARKLDAATACAFEGHVSQCADCARVVDAQTKVWEALDSYEALPTISDDFDQKLWERIEASESRGWWRKLADGPALGWNSVFSWKPAMVAVAGCAAVMAVMVSVGPSEDSKTGGIEKAMIERTVDIDQVEGSIEDLDMLKQLGVMDDPPAAL
jgi:anti-sigma-K factor RskA